MRWTVNPPRREGEDGTITQATGGRKDRICTAQRWGTGQCLPSVALCTFTSPIPRLARSKTPSSESFEFRIMLAVAIKPSPSCFANHPTLRAFRALSLSALSRRIVPFKLTETTSTLGSSGPPVVRSMGNSCLSLTAGNQTGERIAREHLLLGGELSPIARDHRRP